MGIERVKITVARQWFTESSTCGQMLLDGQPFCYTLELPKKDGLPGSCVPTGTYPLAYLFSPRFGRNMPHIIDIPERSGILIHYGNTAEDTKGCILLGLTHEKDFVGDSRSAFDAFVPRFLEGLKAGDLTIEIIEQQTPSNTEEVRSAVTGEA